MKTTALLRRVDLHLALCAAAAGASLAPSAQATVIYSGPVSMNVPTNSAGVYLNVVSGVSGSAGAAVPGWDINPWGVTNLNLFSPTTPAGDVYVGSNGFFNLALDTVIGPGSTFSSGGISATSPNPLQFNSANNLIGFRFQNEAMGNQIQYGWFRIYLSSTPQSQPRMIVDFAYENTGAAIGTPLFPPPNVPEPTTVTFLALALAAVCGIRAWRRRKLA